MDGKEAVLIQTLARMGRSFLLSRKFNCAEDCFRLLNNYANGVNYDQIKAELEELAKSLPAYNE